MKHRKKNIRNGILIVLIVFFVYLFLFGRLFPFSPLIIGFEKKEYRNAIIYYHKTDSVHEFSSIDTIIETVEKFHRLKFKKKVQIFLTASDKEYKRFTGTTARFVTQPLEGRIFVSYRAKTEYRNKKIQFDTYIKHELSHSVLYQNMSLIRSLSYPAWFMEGIAMYSAKQVGTDGYYSYDQTKEKIGEGYFVEPNDWGTIISSKGESVINCKLENKYWFIYSEFALIVNDLIIQGGEDKFIDFLKGTLNKKDFDLLFKNTYERSFEVYISDVKNAANKTL
ncbi:MAG: hypothetical protein NTY07_14395 [Bacteroidia bacterium]|nr:hypothetical protein [Bacteroidia bacterium]